MLFVVVLFQEQINDEDRMNMWEAVRTDDVDKVRIVFFLTNVPKSYILLKTVSCYVQYPFVGI